MSVAEKVAETGVSVESVQVCGLLVDRSLIEYLREAAAIARDDDKRKDCIERKRLALKLD